MAPKIDLTDSIARFENELAAGCDTDRLHFVMEILHRWCDDADLTEASRQRALAVFQRFTTKA